MDDPVMEPSTKFAKRPVLVITFLLAIASFSHSTFVIGDERQKTCVAIQTGDALAQTHCYTSRQAEIAHEHSEAFFKELGDVVATFPSREVLDQQVEALEKRRESGREISVFDMVVGE